MNKKEFLDILRQTLEGEVNSDIIEQNMRYYDQYISSHSDKGEEAVLEELGHPRLIAKTIIETERIAREKGKSEDYTSHNRYYDNRRYVREGEEEENKNNGGFGTRRRSVFFTGFRWYHKAVLWAVLILTLFLLLFIGRIILRLFYVLAIPIILIFVLMSLFRRR